MEDNADTVAPPETAEAPLETVVEVNAAPETVWAILVDLDRYPEWNPYITKAQGTLEEGAQLALTVSAPDRTSFELRPMVVKVLPPWQLSFAFISGEADIDNVESSITIERTARGCRVTNTQRFGGSLPEGIEPRVGERNEIGTEMMYVALKARAERETHG